MNGRVKGGNHTSNRSDLPRTILRYPRVASYETALLQVPGPTNAHDLFVYGDLSPAPLP